MSGEKINTEFYVLEPTMQYYDAQNMANSGSAPAYKYQTSASDVAVGMPASSGPYKEAPRWSWCSTVWSVISMLCCVNLCGFLGLLCSIFSYVDHKAGDYDRADRKRRCSWGCSITGILLVLLLVIAVALLFTLFRQDLAEFLQGFGLTTNI